MDRARSLRRFWPVPKEMRLAAPAIGCDVLFRHPEPFRQLAGLPEHVDRNAAAGIPVAADAQPFRLDLVGDALADHDGAILVEGAVVAKAREIEFKGF